MERQFEKDALEILNKFSQEPFKELPEPKVCNYEAINMTLEYKPNIFKYFDGENWIEIPMNGSQPHTFNPNFK